MAEGDIVELINQTRDNFITVKTQNHRRVGVIPVQCAVTWKIQESTFL